MIADISSRLEYERKAYPYFPVQKQRRALLEPSSGWSPENQFTILKSLINLNNYWTYPICEIIVTIYELPIYKWYKYFFK